MTWKILKEKNNLIKAFFCLYAIVSLSSCMVFKNKDKYEREVSTYLSATSISNFERYYFAMYIDIGEMNEFTGAIIEDRNNAIVIPGFSLLRIMHNPEDPCTSEEFYNRVLRLLVNDEPLIVSPAQFKQLENYIITRKDAEIYMRKSTNQILKEFSPKDKSTYPTIPSYNDRCRLFNLLHNAVTIQINDESGVVLYSKLVKLRPVKWKRLDGKTF